MYLDLDAFSLAQGDGEGQTCDARAADNDFLDVGA